MLSIRHIPRTQIAMPHKWISIAHNTIRLGSNSSSSSSDSSDSDSDLDTRPQKQTVKTTNSNSNVTQKKDLDLYELIDYYVQKTPSKQVDIKISEKDKAEQLEYRITKAAEILTSSVGGDKEKVVSSLLFSLSAIKSEKQSTEPIKEFPSKFKSRNAEKDTLKNERMKTRMNNENKSRTADIKMKQNSISGKLLKMGQESKKPEEPSIIKQLLQTHEEQAQPSISKLLLQKDLSVTEQASKKSQTQTKPPMQSIFKQLLKEQDKQSFKSKTLPQKKPAEPSVIKQLREQQSKTLLQKKTEQLSLIKELFAKSEEQESQPPKSLEDQKQKEQLSVIKTLLKDYREQRGSRQKKQEGQMTQEGQKGQERLEEQERQKMRAQEPSISRMMLNNVSNTRKSRSGTRKPKRPHYMKRETGVSSLHWILFDDDVGEEKRNEEDMNKYYKIFGETNATPSKTAELETWNLCEKKYMKMITTHYPENAFQEMAQWTEEGKMWNFPIDNEQGMDEEHSIHFSEHVFLERHLAGWCPTKGPIRHFMELVCIGMSKNPYMTVQEKYDTIMWYKEFFADKNDLLKKLGLLEIEQNVEKQAQLSQ
ncbi:mitochondrial ribosomal protein S31 [Halictus rubicundus]|uniref:mitochondrial ribosomal protein S31 n=1 Tax=Halictus rubicundus TaxID=77578 RepID=UPI0040362FE5